MLLGIKIKYKNIWLISKELIKNNLINRPISKSKVIFTLSL